LILAALGGAPSAQTPPQKAFVHGSKEVKDTRNLIINFIGVKTASDYLSPTST
jgi:hypothetical protein